MNKKIEIILHFRQYLLARIDSLTIEQLNLIPASYSNNIAWNLGHMNAVLQALCYKSSGLPINIEEKYFHPYLPGTKPESIIDAKTLQTIKQQFIECAEKLDKDLANGLFKAYTKVEKIEKVYNIQVTSIHDAIDYVTHHEGTHYHAILTLKRAIENSHG